LGRFVYFFAHRRTWGQQGFFYETWQSDPTWHRVSVPATQCPRISEKLSGRRVKSHRKHIVSPGIPMRIRRQRPQMFNPDLLRAALRDIEPLHLLIELYVDYARIALIQVVRK
jgi:hypothetical protein